MDEPVEEAAKEPAGTELKDGFRQLAHGR